MIAFPSFVVTATFEAFLQQSYRSTQRPFEPLALLLAAARGFFEADHPVSRCISRSC